MDGELLRTEEVLRQRCSALLASLQQQQQEQQQQERMQPETTAAPQDPPQEAAPQPSASCTQEEDAAQVQSRQLLEELLSLHRASKLQLQQLQASTAATEPPDPAAAPGCTPADGNAAAAEQVPLDRHAARSGKRDQTIQNLRLQLDAHAQALSTALSKAEALVKASRSLVSPAPPLPSPEDILRIGHRIRYTTFAHAGLVSLPPAPQQAQMLNSTLFHFSQQHAADAMPTALTAAVTKPKPPQPPEPPPAAAAAAAAQLPFPSASWKPGDPLPQLPPMPDNWKPGDPLPAFPEGFMMPMNIPDMPPGWQPGDPLPLPPAGPPPPAGAQAMDTDDAPPPPAAAAPPAQAPGKPAAAAKPEILSFLLNPDLEVAEYSSDEDDSEDEF